MVPLLHPKRCAIFEALQDLEESCKRLALAAFGRFYHVHIKLIFVDWH